VCRRPSPTTTDEIRQQQRFSSMTENRTYLRREDVRRSCFPETVIGVCDVCAPLVCPLNQRTIKHYSWIYSDTELTPDHLCDVCGGQIFERRPITMATSPRRGQHACLTCGDCDFPSVEKLLAHASQHTGETLPMQ
jgi:hypothetical protein